MPAPWALTGAATIGAPLRSRTRVRSAKRFPMVAVWVLSARLAQTGGRVGGSGLNASDDG